MSDQNKLGNNWIYFDCPYEGSLRSDSPEEDRVMSIWVNDTKNVLPEKTGKERKEGQPSKLPSQAGDEPEPKRKCQWELLLGCPEQGSWTSTL